MAEHPEDPAAALPGANDRALAVLLESMQADFRVVGETLQDFRADVNARFDRVDHDIVLLKDAVLEHSRELGRHSQRIDANTREVGRCNERIDANTREVGRCNERIDANTRELERHSHRIDANTLELERHGQQIDANTLGLERHGQQIDALRGAVEAKVDRDEVESIVERVVRRGA
jgi:chromosome segregation ATPase